MTREGMNWAFGVIFALFILQSLGTWIQIKDYQKALKRIRPKGTGGIGQKKGCVGHIVLIACDKEGVITDVEAMEGMSIIARFRHKEALPWRTLAGTHILELLNDFFGMDEKKRRYYRGYIQAAEALEKRFYPEEYEERINQGRILLVQKARRKGLFGLGR
jgi:DNA-binding transcriptional regulator of glucitol operon